MIEKTLEIIAKKLKTPYINKGLLQGKMGSILFFYNYSRHFDCRYKEYADKWLYEIINVIHEMNCNYADGIAGVGTGMEYLAQESFIEEETNEILSEVDSLVDRIYRSISHLPPQIIDMRYGVTGYGKYYLARLTNPDNIKKMNPDSQFIEKQLSNIVDLLSVGYVSYRDIYVLLNFLPDIIRLEINKKKADIFLNYAVNLLETMVYEDVFFGKYPESFNPLIAALLLFRSSAKTDRKDLADRAIYFLDGYESGFQPYLIDKHAIKWSFLYHTLWKNCNRDMYKELSIQWLEKITYSGLSIEPGNLITSGMMLLTMNNSINDNWLDWFPLH